MPTNVGQYSQAAVVIPGDDKRLARELSSEVVAGLHNFIGPT